VVEQAGRTLAEIARAFHHQGEHVAGVGRQPALGLLELRRQTRQGTVGKHGGTDRLWRDRVITPGLSQPVEALEGPPPGRAGALHRRFAGRLGSAIRGRHQLLVHVHQVVDGRVVRVAEETPQARLALGGVEQA
jgi:hypothetical protein